MLQACALGKTVSSLGYRLLFLSGIVVRPDFRSKGKAWLDRIGLLQPFLKRRMKRFSSVSERKFHAFKHRVLNVIRVYTDGQLKRLVRHTDVFLSGSDQIWNVVHDFNPFYFLDFAEDAKRISYASSIGTGSVPEEFRPAVKALLEKYSHISVREKSGAAALSELTGRADIEVVLDPVFLLDERGWMSLCRGSCHLVPGEYLLCYFVGDRPQYSGQLERVKNRTGIGRIVVIPSVESGGSEAFGGEIVGDAGPEDFINLLKDAKMVCTDSFHAAAMSLIFAKDFVVFKRFSDEDPASQNSRIYDLLETFGVQNRWYDSGNWETPVDKAAVRDKLEEARETSLSYLVHAIEN